MRRTFLQVAVIGWSLVIAIGALFATTILPNEGERSARAAELSVASELLVATERLHGHTLDALSVGSDDSRVHVEHAAFLQLAHRVATKVRRHADVTAIERDASAFSHELDRALAGDDRIHALENLGGRRDALEHDLDRAIADDRDALADASASARTALRRVRTALALFVAFGAAAAAVVAMSGPRPRPAVELVEAADSAPPAGRPKILQ